MHNLGNTRSAQQPNHLLLTPDTFVRTTLPGMKGCAAIVHVGPALGAGFTQYTAEFEPGGELGGTRVQRFIFVMEGAVKWFEAEKGYGFISPDGGGKDVFIHITALRRSGVNALDPGQRVRVDVVDGKKGLEADRITLI